MSEKSILIPTAFLCVGLLVFPKTIILNVDIDGTTHVVEILYLYKF